METVDVGHVKNLQASLQQLLTGFRRVPANARVEWYNPSSRLSWHDYLLRAVNDPMNDTWQAFIENQPEADRLYRQARDRILQLLPACPERRDLIHGDLLHQNVLVSDDASKISAIFSWKCSAFGDFLYDIAWCTHWAPWHPCIAAADVYALTIDADDLDFAARKEGG